MRRGINVFYSPNENESNGEGIYVIEGIGATSYAFFPLPVCIINEEIQQLKCFQNEIEFINFSQDTTCELRIKTGIHQVNKTRYAIYPNPVVQQLNIDGLTAYSVLIYNQLGQLVYQKSKLSNKVQLDLSELDRGIYNLVIQNNQGELSFEKLMISN